MQKINIVLASYDIPPYSHGQSKIMVHTIKQAIATKAKKNASE